MMNKTTKLNDGVRRFKFNPAGYCGVVMTEPVMKKLARLTENHERAVREVLRDHVEELHTYHWTCASEYAENGQIVRQIIVEFILQDDSRGLDARIKLFRARQPEYLPELYVFDSHEDAKALAEHLLQIAVSEHAREQT